MLALLLRGGLVLWLNFAPPHLRPVMAIFAADALVYDELARNVASGQGYQLQGDFREYTRIPPLFPFYLAALYKIWGSSVVGTGLINSLLGALTAVALYFLVRAGFARDEPAIVEDSSWKPSLKAELTLGVGERVALGTAAIFAIYPLEIFNTPYVLKENFSIFLTVGFALCWSNLMSANKAWAAWLWALATGIALGLATLSRYPHAGLLFVFLLANGWMLWRERSPHKITTSVATARLPARWAAILIGVPLVFALTMTPWLWRNYQLFDEVMLSNHGMGRALNAANSRYALPERNGYFEGQGDRSAYDRAFEKRAGDDHNAKDGLYAGAAVRDMLLNPQHTLKLWSAKIVSMWRPVWEGSSVRSWLVLGVPYLALMALALPGLVLVWRSPQRHRFSWGVLYTMVAFYCCGHLIFYGMIRERQYVEPYLMAFASYAWFQLVARRARNSASLIAQEASTGLSSS